ncbi:MAG: GyrI-like domain-containing protein [Ginsengibacter sp.]
MKTTKKFLKGFKLTGISLSGKTSNENGQSGIDCGNLWQEFEKGDYQNKIPNKLSDDIFAVYYDYEGDHTQPFSYFIGCKTSPEIKVPEGFESLVIEDGNYEIITAEGKMPDCISNAWKRIWQSDIPRSYRKDFEVYDEKSRDWNNAEVNIYVSLR